MSTPKPSLSPNFDIVRNHDYFWSCCASCQVTFLIFPNSEDQEANTLVFTYKIFNKDLLGSAEYKILKSLHPCFFFSFSFLNLLLTSCFFCCCCDFVFPSLLTSSTITSLWPCARTSLINFHLLNGGNNLFHMGWIYTLYNAVDTRG